MKESILTLAKTDAYIVTKPLQYINVQNILNTNRKILLLINAFSNAPQLFQLIQNRSKFWSKTLFFSNTSEALNWVIRNKYDFETLYIDSDINHKIAFFKLRNLNITIYEEGVGTYMRELYSPRRRYIGKIYLSLLSSLGYKNRRGGNKYTKNIIVYFPEFYKKHINENKKKVTGFNIDFLSHLETFEDRNIFENTINYEIFRNKSVLVYITDWCINNDLEFKDEYDLKVIKPHPHIKNINIVGYDNIIPSSIPAEIFLLNLKKVAKNITIISNYSTSTIYFLNDISMKINNIEFTPINYFCHTSYLEAYEKLSEYIQKTSIESL